MKRSVVIPDRWCQHMKQDPCHFCHELSVGRGMCCTLRLGVLKHRGWYNIPKPKFCKATKVIIEEQPTKRKRGD